MNIPVKTNLKISLLSSKSLHLLKKKGKRKNNV